MPSFCITHCVMYMVVSIWNQIMVSNLESWNELKPGIQIWNLKIQPKSPLIWFVRSLSIALSIAISTISIWSAHREHLQKAVFGLLLVCLPSVFLPLVFLLSSIRQSVSYSAVQEGSYCKTLRCYIHVLSLVEQPAADQVDWKWQIESAHVWSGRLLSSTYLKIMKLKSLVD